MRRSERRVVAAIGVLLAMSGCDVRHGVPASDSSWRSDADEALGSAASSLGTAAVVLEARLDDKLPGPMATAALDDAVQNLDKDVGKYLRAQPPVDQAGADRTVAQILLKSLGTLRSVDVAATNPERPRWRKALGESRAMVAELADARRYVQAGAR